jgi:hypothetical protein
MMLKLIGAAILEEEIDDNECVFVGLLTFIMLLLFRGQQPKPEFRSLSSVYISVS